MVVTSYKLSPVKVYLELQRLRCSERKSGVGNVDGLLVEKILAQRTGALFS